MRPRLSRFLGLNIALSAVAAAGIWTSATAQGIGQWFTWPLAVVLAATACCWAVLICYALGGMQELTFPLLIPHKASRLFRSQLLSRTAMDDNQFFVNYYAGIGVPRAIVDGIRASLRRRYKLADRLVPSDDLTLIDGELDLAQVARWVGAEVGLRFARDEISTINGRLDDFVQAAWRKSKK
jgi:hypothetical protein